MEDALRAYTRGAAYAAFWDDRLGTIETGKLEPVARMVKERLENGLHQQFDAVSAMKKYNPNDVAAARAYVGAYVEYVHYVERLYDAAGVGGGEHAQHAAEKPAAKPATHGH